MSSPEWLLLKNFPLSTCTFFPFLRLRPAAAYFASSGYLQVRSKIRCDIQAHSATAATTGTLTDFRHLLEGCDQMRGICGVGTNTGHSRSACSTVFGTRSLRVLTFTVCSLNKV